MKKLRFISMFIATPKRNKKGKSNVSFCDSCEEGYCTDGVVEYP